MGKAAFLLAAPCFRFPVRSQGSIGSFCSVMYCARGVPELVKFAGTTCFVCRWWTGSWPRLGARTGGRPYLVVQEPSVCGSSTARELAASRRSGGRTTTPCAHGDDSVLESEHSRADCPGHVSHGLGPPPVLPCKLTRNLSPGMFAGELLVAAKKGRCGYDAFQEDHAEHRGRDA
jgi:hypothetical protein